MHHVAILEKKLKLLDKIISGEKTIESRWYLSRRSPWNRISKGDVVFFKNSGEKVSVRAKVSKALQIELNPEKVKVIIKEYGKDICIDTSFNESFKDKKYCILIFLEDVEEIGPFSIDKTGFGLMSAWISVEDINSLK